MKKLLNKPEDIMDEMLAGMAMANQKILRLEPGTHRMTRRVPKEQGKVKLIIGNGGGHEPGAIGWIGYGMYDMDCMGEVFTAQSGKKLFEAIKDMDDGSPVLLTIANHAGDVMNGNLACQMAKDAGINIRQSIFYDDIASAPKGFEEERRGLTGMMLGVKMAGAAAEEGASLDECVLAFEKTRDNTRSISIALSGCTHPQTGMMMMEVPDGEVNIGAGVHGEGGVSNRKLTTSWDIVTQTADLLITDMPFEKNDEVIVLVNGMGSTTMMELAIFYQDVCKYLASKGILIYDGLADSFFTTQEMAGVTLSLCKMDAQMKKWWDAPCHTPSYTNR